MQVLASGWRTVLLLGLTKTLPTSAAAPPACDLCQCACPTTCIVPGTPSALTAALPLQVLVFGTTPQVRQAVLHGLLKQSPQAAAAPPPRAARQMPMLAGMGRPSAAEDGDLAAGLVCDWLTEAVRPLVACD